ncbi:hypothetical protein IWQ60_003007 [Tieghemiomyces parasiticus]|uniref:Uncharacterized protein n=1 Tax=Tieghemiomyces parasiticus TaxID=78921 RepID=A0A9W8E135_9FUNG|nr:hypothetical protein IWQ60_003007 [Tieghemiomyces parasiticus]
MLKPSTYPIRGIGFLAAHPSIWCRCFCGLLAMLTIAIASLVGFSFLISTTAHALIRVNCPAGLAWTVAVVAMFIESALAVIILGLILMPVLQDTLFDDVLRLRGLENVLLNPAAQQRHAWARGIAAGILFGLFQVLVLLLSLPLNAIPIAGTVLAAAINGIILAWGYHLHYLVELRGMTFRQSRRWVSLNRSKYMGFGVTAFLLELVPLLNVVFMLTNAIGSALWAEAMYREELVNRYKPGHEYWEVMPLLLPATGQPGTSPAGPSEFSSPDSVTVATPSTAWTPRYP